ncbi:glob1 [Trypoxylus dichotomus]
MGVITSYLRGSNDPDPVTGLTPKEKALVVSSWNLVKKDLTANGVELFKLFFKHKPEYQNYFPFRGVPMDELTHDPKLKAHAISVMYALSSIIDNLDNSDVLVNLLQKTGESHRRRKIPEESFNVLHKTVLELLQKGLGPKLSKEGLDAWDKTLTVALKVVKDTLRTVESSD